MEEVNSVENNCANTDCLENEEYDAAINEDLEALLQNNKERKLKEEVNEIFDDLDKKGKAVKAVNNEFEQSIDTIKNNFKLQNRVVNAHCNNIFSDIKIKKNYSIILLIILGIQIVFLDVMFIMVGKGCLEFSDLTLNLFITAGLLELIGLVTIIVKYLFNDNTTESLRIISHINDKL